MNEKDKMIEEMAKDLEPFLTLHREVYVNANRKERHGWMLSEEDNKVIAERLIKQNYRNCKDKVVLSKEEYNSLLLEQNRLKEIVDRIPCGYELKNKTRKQTAKEILQIIKEEYDYIGDLERIIAKQYGVEWKE